MFALAVKWRMRPDNPCKGVERSEEHRRETFLSPAQILKLGEVLLGHPERASARAVQLLLLTGARRGEVLGARWSEFDLAAGVWDQAARQYETEEGPPAAPVGAGVGVTS